MVGSTAVLPTPKHRHNGGDKDVASPTSSEYDSPKTPGGMTAQRMQCFKTKRCRFWLESRCTRGDRCTYAHTDVELRIPPDLTKTKICTRWKRGTCDKEAGECAYAHGMEDLREATTPSTVTNTGRSAAAPEGLSFGVPPPATKLRDSPPYSSRSCQTISSTASTRYTSRRDSDASSNDGQTTQTGAAAVKQQQPRVGKTAAVSPRNGCLRAASPSSSSISPAAASPAPPPVVIPAYGSSSPAPGSGNPSSSPPPILPLCGSPNKSAGPQSSPIMVECSGMTGAAAGYSELCGGDTMMLMAAPSSGPSPMELASSEAHAASSRAAVYAAAQYYHIPASAHHPGPSSDNNPLHSSSSMMASSIARVCRMEESQHQKTDRYTPDELLLAVLTVPYYD